jgi:hypothetical protein
MAVRQRWLHRYISYIYTFSPVFLVYETFGAAIAAAKTLAKRTGDYTLVIDRWVAQIPSSTLVYRSLSMATV